VTDVGVPEFPELDESQLAAIATVGTRRRVDVGDFLYREGDVTYDFFVVLSGRVDIVMAQRDGEPVITSHGPGRFLGELNMLTGQRVFVSARVAEAGELIHVPVADLRRLIATQPLLADTIVGAFMARRAGLLSGAASAIRVIGSRFSPRSGQVREFLTRSRIPHEWLDSERDAEIEVGLQHMQVTADDLPIVIVSGTVLRSPTPGELAEYLGVTVGNLPDRCFDLVIVGGGPGGLAAAVYGASEGLRTLAVDSIAPGGQAGTSSRIENYLGFPTGISGGDLAQRAFIQAERLGATLTSPCAATSLGETAGHLVVGLSDGTEVAGRAVIVATGARYRRLDVERLEQFECRGVYYAATAIEARECSAAPVIVAGGGNSAGQAAAFLADSGSAVTVVIRGSDLNKSMSRYLVERIEAHPRIELRTNTTIAGLDGDDALTTVRLAGDKGTDVVPCAGLFSFIGADPSSGWLSGCAALDGRGFVLTDRSLTSEHLDERWSVLARDPLPFETSHPGLFAVGDVRAGSTKRVAAAVGEGSAAVRSVHDYLAFAE
jgi:thioredoxin reductase (NADPH)